MKKIFFIFSLAVLFISLGAQTAWSDKRCERCQRGPDGKMECVEVPCP